MCFMSRFTDYKQKHVIQKWVLSICVFLLMLILFSQGISSLSKNTKRRQKEALENAILRNITYCYTLEGSYPKSLNYLKENYGLTYDEDLFFVDYRVSGSNIFPEITIIERDAVK